MDSREELEQYCIETMIQAHQECEIAKRYGIEAAGKVNYGWGTDIREDGYIVVSSKLYGHNEVLVTAAGPALEFEDTWEPYIVRDYGKGGIRFENKAP